MLITWNRTFAWHIISLPFFGLAKPQAAGEFKHVCLIPFQLSRLGVRRGRGNYDMKVVPISPLPFAPSLPRRLERIAHTILPRLAWTFRVVPRPWCEAIVAQIQDECLCHRDWNRLPNGLIAELAERWPQGQLQIERNLGMEIYIDTLLAGSQIGERLPLANCRIDEERCAAGLALDLSA